MVLLGLIQKIIIIILNRLRHVVDVSVFQQCSTDAIFCAVLFCFSVGLSITADAAAAFKSQNLGRSVEFLEDPQGSMSLEDVLAVPKQDWQQSTRHVPTMGITHSTYWFKIDFQSREQMSENLSGVKLPNAYDRYWLVISNSNLDYLDVYWMSEGEQIEKLLLGEYRPFSNREKKHPFYILSLPSFEEQPLTMLARVQNQDGIKLPVEIWDKEAFYEDDRRNLLLQGAYFGLMLVMLLYNLFLYLNMKERRYLFYVMYVGSLALHQFAYQGFAYQYFYPSDSGLNPIFIRTFFTIGLVSVILFTNDILNVKTAFPIHYKINNAIAVLAVVLYVVRLKSYAVELSFVILAMLVSIFLIMLYLSVRLILRRDQTAVYFLAAWSVLIFKGILVSMAEIGVVSSSWFTEHAIQMGSSIEVVLLSFALVEKMRQERAARFAAQQQLVKESETRAVIEKQLNEKNYYDRLTGFGNLLMFRKKMAEVIDGDNDQRLAFILVYFNRFYEINNTLGFETGDLLLKNVTAKLNELVSCIDNHIPLHGENQTPSHIASVGGVTYIFVVEIQDPREVQAIAESVLDKMRKPFSHQGLMLDVGVHIGSTIYPDLEKDVDVLLKQGEIAKETSQRNESRFALYSSSMDPYSERRLSLMGELRHAIATNQLMLFYQPQVDIQTNELIGVEALLRWTHPEHGFIAPDEFIPLAEQTGLIKLLTHWVVDTALEQLHQFRMQGIDLTMSINISAKNLLEADLYDYLVQGLDSKSIPHECLVLEITETAMMIDPDNALQVLTRLHDSSIQVSIDDFGTGYSSLAYLKQLPVDEIKIDRSFVMDMPNNRDDAMIVTTTLSMSHNMGMKVVAEGIENQETWDQLKKMGCDIAQGYFLTKPLPAEQLLKWLEGSNVIIRKLLQSKFG